MRFRLVATLVPLVVAAACVIPAAGAGFSRIELPPPLVVRYKTDSSPTGLIVQISEITSFYGLPRAEGVIVNQGEASWRMASVTLGLHDATGERIATLHATTFAIHPGQRVRFQANSTTSGISITEGAKLVFESVDAWPAQ